MARYTLLYALRLSHECILDIIGYSHDGPSLCILYPFMRLGSLDRLITDKDTLPPFRRVSVACDVARALQYLHCSCERVVVHRDVKRYDTSGGGGGACE